MDPSRSVRLLSLAGIGAGALWIVGLVLLGTNRPGNPREGAEILAYYQQHGDALGMAVFLLMLGSVLFLVFLASLWSRLRRAEGAEGPVAALVLVAGVIVSIGQFAVFGSDLDLSGDATKYAVSASTAEAAFFTGDSWFVAAAMMAGLMLMATGVIAIRTGALPRALGWVSVALAVPLLLPMLPIMPPLMLFAFPVWVAVTALVLSVPHAAGALAPRPV
jgi:hypothetical protein